MDARFPPAERVGAMTRALAWSISLREFNSGADPIGYPVLSSRILLLQLYSTFPSAVFRKLTNLAGQNQSLKWIDWLCEGACLSALALLYEQSRSMNVEISGR